jgi:hypothetical protein
MTNRLNIRSRSLARWRGLAAAVAGALLAAGVGVGGAGDAGAAAAAAPSNNSPPSISGTPQLGNTLSASSGSWSGDTPMSFGYRWRRCNASGAGCADIGGATSSTYTVVSADVGKTLRVNVTATNSDGSGEALSAATNEITAAAKPANTSKPTISGTLRQNETLTAANGSWSGATPMSFAYSWLRCSSDLTPCLKTNVTTQTYKLGADEVGKRMIVTVTASNSAGSASADSSPTGVVAQAGNPPASTSPPTISGTVEVGKTLTAGPGGWTNNPSFAYQWLRCDANGSACAAIAAATASTYAVTAADVGARLRVLVTAQNAFGSASAQSSPTGVVPQPAPAGSIRLPTGVMSVPVSSVSLPERLIIQRVTFSPNPVRSRAATIVLQVRIVDTRGYAVRDALVYARSTPLLTTTAPEARTGEDGTATLTFLPKTTFPLRNGMNVQFFVRVRKEGENVLRGVTASRLVQVRTARPS